MQLFDYQTTAVSQALCALSAEGKALIHLATGLGKTMVMKEISKSYAGSRILFLVHDVDILEQNMERFTETFNRFGEVGAYHGHYKMGISARIVFSTFQTMFSAKENFGPDAFALILVDECHHAPAPTFKAVIDYFDGHKLGASATIERFDEESVEEIFGPPVMSIELPEAIANGYLTPFEYRVMSDSLSAEVLEELLKSIEQTRRLTLSDINKTLFIEKRDEEIALHIKEETGKRKTLVFCRNIDHATRMVKLLGKLAVTTHSGIKKDTNNQRLKAFRMGQVQYLVVVNKANEGVDIPDAEVVVFLRSTESKTIFLQQLGRTLRKSEGKTLSMVLDFVGSLERIYDIRTMASDIASRFGNGGGGYVTPSFLTVSGEGYDFQFDAKVISALELLERLKSKEFYSYSDAKERMLEMGIISQIVYGQRYKEDARLPCDPDRIYKNSGWKNWPVFFSKRSEEPFYSYDEAKDVVKKLGIKTEREYRTKKKKDSLLPGTPFSHYKDSGWDGWTMFLSGKKKDPFYSYEEAQSIVQRHDIRAESSYKKFRKQDSKLPSTPNAHFKETGWINWAEFLGTVPYDYDEARLAAIKLGFKSAVDYKNGYKKDKRLISNPQTYYMGKGWISWLHYLGKTE
jgi:superfamily II DNA or RNA helicase